MLTELEAQCHCWANTRITQLTCATMKLFIMHLLAPQMLLGRLDALARLYPSASSGSSSADLLATLSIQQPHLQRTAQ
jgi:hypothetical protein